MPSESRYPTSPLFTVRVWWEERGHGQTEVRIQARHVLSGETRYFRDWPALVAYLIAKGQESEASHRLAGSET